MPHANADARRWSLSLFGGPTLHRPGGEEVPLTPSHRRLLALVWAHGHRGVQRRSAIWLLWEEEDDRKSRHRLRQLVHDLGNRLGLRAVGAEGEDLLAPSPALVTSDLDDFHQALADRRLQDALALHQRGFGVLLDGRGCLGEYEDWLLAKREGLRRQLRDAAAWQWDRYRPVSAWEPAREAAEVFWALDPESEEAAQRLIEARAMTGNLEAAEAVAADFLARRPQEQHVLADSHALLERIRRAQPVQTFHPSQTPAPPPLVGRRPGLATARRMLGRVGEGSFEFLLISGEAGAGKTRVMEEVWKEANLAGFRCLEARPVEVERPIPLNPLVDMMGDPSVIRHIQRLEEPWRAVIASLLPTLPEGMDPPVVPPIADGSLSRRLLDAFATLFAQMVDEEPLLLFLDDLQWADATTVAVLQFVQRRWRAGALGIIATVRPDLVSRSDSVAKYLNDTPDLPVTTVELGELTDAEARTLVHLVAGQDTDPADVTRLCALGGRIPFYLIELTRDYMAGKVHLPELPTDAITLPISLRQLLEPRIQRVGPDAAAVGSYLAVWGRELGLADLARLTNLPVAEAARHAESLERARLALVDRGKVSLAHGLFRSALYQGLTATRRALLHGEVAAFLEASDSPQAGELTIHHDRAGNAAGAAAWGRVAADKALESGAVAEAAHFLQLVVDNETDATLKAEATADLARVLHMNREILRANPLLELAATRLRAVGNHARALRMDIRRVEGLAEVGAAPLSELLDRLATIKEAARADGDDEALALALDSELHLLHRSGEVTSIRRLFDEVRVVAASADPAAACLANASLALNVLFGDPEEALRCAREAVRLAEEGELRRHLLLAYNKLFFVLLYRGQSKTPEASTTVAAARRLAEKSGDVMMRFHLESNCGVAEMDACDYDRAEHHFGRATSILRGAAASVMRLNHTYNLGELSYLRGEFAEALAHFQQVERHLGEWNQPRDIVRLLNAALGLCSLEIGALAEARSRETPIDDPPGSWTFDPTMVLAFASRFLERRGKHGEARDLLKTHADALRPRLPIAWMKTLQLEARLSARLEETNWRERLGEAYHVAIDLGLTGRASEIREILDTPPRRRAGARSGTR